MTASGAWRLDRYNVRALVEAYTWDAAACGLGAILQQYADEVHVSTQTIASTSYEWHGNEMPPPIQLHELGPLRPVRMLVSQPFMDDAHPGDCPCRLHTSMRPDWDLILREVPS